MTTVDAKEIENFAKDAAQWWDVNGPFAPLHKLNPVRLSYLRTQIDDHYGCDPKDLSPYKNLSVLDIGCGGGLVCEPMARLGASITGIDADAQAIAAAKDHAVQSGLTIDYRAVTTADLQQQYDVVLALEIIEHVSDPAQFVREVAALAKPGGLVIFSTLNRTVKSYALGIVAAEYVLRWVPAGTHTWKKFVKPSELSRLMRAGGLTPKNIQGMVYHPLNKKFALSANDTDVNYFMSARKT
jgi:2-polyprenyl-6-hydroxyphenyl methylase / 3-demethylubiquinone-9 3-methyltransferase